MCMCSGTPEDGEGKDTKASVDETVSLGVGRHEERANFVKQGSVTNKLGIYQPSQPLRWPI